MLSLPAFSRPGAVSTRPATPAAPLFGKKFQSLREANALFESELRERGITADTLWNDWGVWLITSSYNYLGVWVNPKKNRKFDATAFTEWLGTQIPQYKARMMAGESRPNAWISIRKETRCCGNGCTGCRLTADPEAGIGRITRGRRSWIG